MHLDYKKQGINNIITIVIEKEFEFWLKMFFLKQY